MWTNLNISAYNSRASSFRQFDVTVTLTTEVCYFQARLSEAENDKQDEAMFEDGREGDETDEGGERERRVVPISEAAQTVNNHNNRHTNRNGHSAL